jgi:hypothetical protein
MYSLAPNPLIPRKTRIRIAVVIEPSSVWENTCATTDFHAIYLKNGDEAGFFADSRVMLLLDALALMGLDGLMDTRGPVLGVLTVA